MTTDDRGDHPTGSDAADKDALQRAVEEQTAAAEAAAGSEPIVNAEPPAKRTTAKKAPASSSSTSISGDFFDAEPLAMKPSSGTIYLG